MCHTEKWDNNPCAWSNDTADHSAAGAVCLLITFLQKLQGEVDSPHTFVCQISPVPGDYSVFLASCRLYENACSKWMFDVPWSMYLEWEFLFQVLNRCSYHHVACMRIPVPSNCSMPPDPCSLYKNPCSKYWSVFPQKMFPVSCFLWESMFQVTVIWSLYHVPCKAIPVTNDCLMFPISCSFYVPVPIDCSVSPAGKSLLEVTVPCSLVMFCSL